MTMPVKSKRGIEKAWLKVLMYFSALIGLFCLSEFAVAQGGDLGDVAETIRGSLSGVAKLISAASYVAGLAFALTGLFKFKAHKDNPTQVPISQPITLLAISAGLIFLPSVIETAGQTVFGGGSSEGVEGSDSIGKS